MKEKNIGAAARWTIALQSVECVQIKLQYFIAGSVIVAVENEIWVLPITLSYTLIQKYDMDFSLNLFYLFLLLLLYYVWYILFERKYLFCFQTEGV